MAAAAESLFEAHSGMLITTARAIASLDPHRLTKQQLAVLAHFRDSLDAVICRTLVVQTTPVEQLLPLDVLLHAIDFLPSNDLPAASLACRHFTMVAQATAGKRLERRFGMSDVDRATAGRSVIRLLLVLETQLATLLTLLEKLNSSMKDVRVSDIRSGCGDTAEEIVNELKSLDRIVLSESIHTLHATIQRLQGDELDCLRGELFALLFHGHSRRVAVDRPLEDIEEVAKTIAAEVRRGNKGYASAHMFLSDLPATVLEKHMDTIVLALQSWNSNLAVRALSKVRDDVLRDFAPTLKPLVVNLIEDRRAAGPLTGPHDNLWEHTQQQHLALLARLW